MTPTLEEIEAQRTPAGGFTRDGLANLGVDWPPPRGWHKRLVREAKAAKAAAHAKDFRARLDEQGGLSLTLDGQSVAYVHIRIRDALAAIKDAADWMQAAFPGDAEVAVKALLLMAHGRNLASVDQMVQDATKPTH